jgi:hypothetical protein
MKKICIHSDRNEVTNKKRGIDTSMSSDGYFFLSVRTWFQKEGKLTKI